MYVFETNESFYTSTSIAHASPASVRVFITLYGPGERRGAVPARIAHALRLFGARLIHSQWFAPKKLTGLSFAESQHTFSVNPRTMVPRDCYASTSRTTPLDERQAAGG